MTRELIIFGAGLAGLIAARMLADRSPTVLERQDSLPNNHHAVLRFRSSVVGDVTNVPFRRVRVVKHVLSDSDSNPIRDALVYSRKVTGKLQARSILDVTPSERFIAPPDLVQRLAGTARVTTGVDFRDWSHNLLRPHGPIISTIPMPIMMEMFEWKDIPEFGSSPGWTVKGTLSPDLEPDVFATIYDARWTSQWYRASITGAELMVEGVGDVPVTGDALFYAEQAAVEFGLLFDGLVKDVRDWTVHPARYQKISEFTSAERESAKRFIMWLSQEHQIYSLGRFATWRPKLLLDDLVNDVRVIARLIDGESHYNEVLRDRT